MGVDTCLGSVKGWVTFLGYFCAPKIVNWFVFVELDADEDVVRLRTCKRSGVTKFDMSLRDDVPRLLSDSFL